MDERQAIASSWETLEKKSLATENMQLSINNLSVLALAIKPRVIVLDDVSFYIATASLNIDIEPDGCGKFTLLHTLLDETIL